MYNNLESEVIHLHENLGYKIKALRISLGKTLEEFGDLIGGVNKSNVSRWEKDLAKPTNERLEKIAELAGMTLAEFKSSDSVNLTLYKTEALKERIRFLRKQQQDIKDKISTSTNKNKLEEELRLLEALILNEQNNLIQAQQNLLSVKSSLNYLTSDSISIESLLTSDANLTFNNQLMTADDKKRALELFKLVFK